MRLLIAMLLGFLLSNPCFAQSGQEQIKAKIDQAYEQAVWSDLTIEFRQVRQELTDGFTPMKLKNPNVKENVYYVSSVPELGLKDFSGIDVFYTPWMEDSMGIVIYLNNKGKEKFKAYTAKHVKEFIGIVIDGELRSAIKVMEPLDTNRLEVDGFSPNEAVGIAKRFFKPLKSIWPYFR
jgi:preprotein translocase subunit SecD